MRTAALAFSLALCGCHAPEPAAVPAPAATVEVLRNDDGAWVARYSAQGSVDELHFDRPGWGFRAAGWPVLTPGYHYRDDGSLVGATPQSVVDIRLAPVTAVEARAWPPVLAFSDGGVAAFGGFLAARDGKGRQFDGIPADDYFYRGPLQPQDVGGLWMILDPALPAWMAEVAMRRVPELIDHYAAATALELPAGVQLMITYSRAGDLVLSGATTPGTVVVAVSGTEWQQGDPWQVEHFVRFLAHEAAHLWNAGIARFEPGTPAWLHEGAAEAFADRALLALGLVDEHRFDALVSAAVERCARGGARADYDCGNAHATEAERAAGEMDLFGLWGELLQGSAATGRRYTVADWCALLARHDAAVSPCRGGTGERRAAGTGY